MPAHPSGSTDLENPVTSGTTGPMTSILGSIALGLSAVILVSYGADRARNPIEVSKVACRAMLKGHEWPIFSLAWSPDGRSLAISGFGPVVRLWEPDTGKVRSLEGGTEQPRFALGWSGDGRKLILGGLDVPVESWAIDDDHRDDEDGKVSPGSRMSDSLALAGSTRGCAIRLWGPSDRRSTMLPSTGRSSNTFAFSPDGRSIASGSSDGICRIWDLESGREKLSLSSDRGGINSVAFSPDGSKIASGGVGPVRLWDASSGKELARLGDSSSGSASVAFSPDGRYIAGAAWDGSVRIWDLSTGLLLAKLRGHLGQILALAWSPDGKRLASSGYDSTVRLWDLTELGGVSLVD